MQYIRPTRFALMTHAGTSAPNWGNAMILRWR